MDMNQAPYQHQLMATESLQKQTKEIRLMRSTNLRTRTKISIMESVKHVNSGPLKPVIILD